MWNQSNRVEQKYLSFPTKEQISVCRAVEYGICRPVGATAAVGRNPFPRGEGAGGSAATGGGRGMRAVNFRHGSGYQTYEWVRF